MLYVGEISGRFMAPTKIGLLFTCTKVNNQHYPSEGTKAWAEEHNLPLLTLPGVSPDFSILESMPHSLIKAFISL
jgi:hypothetical protein